MIKDIDEYLYDRMYKVHGEGAQSFHVLVSHATLLVPPSSMC